MYLYIALNSTNIVMINLNENENFYLVATLLCSPSAKLRQAHKDSLKLNFVLGSLEESPTSPRKPQWWEAAQSITAGKQANAEPNPACSWLLTRKQVEGRNYSCLEVSPRV